MGIQVALPRLGNGLQAVFKGGSPMKTVDISGRMEMSSSNVRAAGGIMRQKLASENAKAIRNAVERPTLLSVSA